MSRGVFSIGYSSTVIKEETVSDNWLSLFSEVFQIIPLWFNSFELEYLFKDTHPEPTWQYKKGWRDAFFIYVLPFFESEKKARVLS